MEIAITIAICWVAFWLGVALLAVGFQLVDYCDSKSRYYISMACLYDQRFDNRKCEKCGR